MPFASSFIVPYTEINGTPIPVPASIGFPPTPQGDVYGFRTSSLHSVAHRNWMPCAWDITGTSRAGFGIVGYTHSPGRVSVSNPGSYEEVNVEVDGQWEFSGPTLTRILPDFSLPTTQWVQPNWFGSEGNGYHPTVIKSYPNIYPIYWDQSGGNQTGWFLEVSFRFYALFERYQSEWEGSYYEIQECRVEVGKRGVPAPGSEPPDGWSLAEGSQINDLGGGGTTLNTNFDRQAAGSVQVRDDTGTDPEIVWGSQTLWGTTGFPSTVIIHVRRNHLPREPY